MPTPPACGCRCPPDSPFASVSVKPKTGWTASTTEANLATPTTNDDGETVSTYVSEIAWSGGEIKPGEFDEFEISVGPVPEDATELTFQTIQIYSNGEQVAWIDEPTADGEEGEHPAPTVAAGCRRAVPTTHGASTNATTAGSASAESASATTDDDDHDSRQRPGGRGDRGRRAGDHCSPSSPSLMGRKKPTSSA